MIRPAVPWLLVLLRLLAGPLLIFNAIAHSSELVVPLCMVAAFLSDIFDGVLARRFGVATPLLRRADSVVDLLFYTCVAIALRFTRPELWRQWWPMLIGFLVLEAIVHAVHVARFHRPAAVHAYSSKLWGVVLFVVAMALLMRSGGGVLCWVVLIGGAIAYAELLAVVTTSPTMPIDVRSIFDVRRSTHQPESATVLAGADFSSPASPASAA